MKVLRIDNLLPLALVLVCGALLAWWVRGSPALSISVRVPGTDRPAGGLAEAELGLVGRLIAYGGEAPDLPGAWPRFLGPAFDNVSREETKLSRQWGKEGPPVLWKLEVGEGYAGPAVMKGRVYLMDYDPPDAWFLRAEDIKDWAGLCRGIGEGGARDRPTPGRRVWQRMPPDARAIIKAGGEPADDDAKTALLDALNDVLKQRELFDAASFAGLELTGEARRLLGIAGIEGEDIAAPRAPEDVRDLFRLNRILFDLAWPEAINRSLHGDHLRCLSLADGQELWRYFHPVKVKRFHGMSRTVPAVTERFVLALDPKCRVICVDAVKGELLWSKDLVREFGATVPPWYAGQCPLIDGERGILAPGGRALLIAVDCATGEVIWETTNPRGWRMTHSSVVPMELGGRRMYVYCASGGVVGVSAEDGRILWETDAWKIRLANVPTPVVIGDGRLFLSGGYSAGSMMLRIREEGGRFVPEPLFRLTPREFGSTNHTPVLYEGHIYGVLPNDAGAAARQLVCLNLEGQHVWTSGRGHRFGIGPFMIADGMLYVMDDDGHLTVAEATPEGFKPLASAEIFPDGHESWGPMAIAGGRLIARDLLRMACLDVREARE